MVLSGKDILSQLFDNKDVNAWGMIGVLIAYIIFFRLVHYALFLYSSRPFLATNEDAGPNKKQGAQDAYQSVAKAGTREIEMV